MLQFGIIQNIILYYVIGNSLRLLSDFLHIFSVTWTEVWLKLAYGYDY